MFHAIVMFILSLIIIYQYPSRLQSWANTLGVLATILAAIQYLPQLYTTWRLQAVGSLSIPTMCIQTPGSFIWAASLAKRLGLAGWSTWGLYLVTGTLQGMVLAACISFEIRDRRKREETGAFGSSPAQNEGSDGYEEDAEDTRLLGHER